MEVEIIEEIIRTDSDKKSWVIERYPEFMVLTYADMPIMNGMSEYEGFTIEGGTFEDYYTLRYIVSSTKTIALLKKFKIDGFDTNPNLVAYN